MGVPSSLAMPPTDTESEDFTVDLETDIRYSPDEIFYPLIKSALLNKVTIEDAAKKILEHCPADEGLSSEVWELVQQLAQVAHCCPPKHVAVRRLSDLVAALRQSPKWTIGGDQNGDFHLKMALTEQFGAETTALMWYEDDEGASQEQKNNFSHDLQFRNFHSTTCGLSRAIFGPPKTTEADSWCVWMMEAGNEGGHERFEGTRMRDGYPLAAAQWVFDYGQTLYACVKGNASLLSNYYGPLWKDEAVKLKGDKVAQRDIVLRRWAFWKKQFRALAAGERDQECKFHDTTKQAAAKAADMMEQIESQNE